MKDYYKILGLKGSASDEEIRARWIELVKDCHHEPELGMEFDERVKEINEAYQVLKNASTKLEYDFQREMDVKIKKFRINKWVPRIALLVVLLILCFIYFENPQLPIDLTSRPPKSIASQKSSVSSAPVKTPETSQTTQAVAPPSEPSPAVKPQKENAAKESTNDLGRLTHSTTQPLNKLNESNRSIDLTTQPLNTLNQTSTPNNSITNNSITNNSITNNSNQPIDASTHERINASTQRPNDSSTPPLNALNGSVNSSTRRLNDSKTQRPRATSVQNKVAPVSTVKTEVKSPELKPVVFTQPSLVAGEEEVRQFFTNYTKVYAQRDIDAFMALFSPQAVQNKQEGLDEIKSIYTRFFRRSEALDYRMKDLTFEIYQNGVEAKANYELDQLLKRHGEKRAWKGEIHWFLIRENGSLKILSLEYQHEETL